MQMPFRQKTTQASNREQKHSNDAATSAEDLATQQPKVCRRAKEHKPRAPAVMGCRIAAWQMTGSATVLLLSPGEYIGTLKRIQPNAKTTLIPPPIKPSVSITGPARTFWQTQNKRLVDPRSHSLRGALHSTRIHYVTARCNCACFRARTIHAPYIPSYPERLTCARIYLHPATAPGWPRTVP